MSAPHGFHYSPCKRGGGLAVAAVAGVVLLAGSGALTAAVTALTSLLEIALACTLAAVALVTAAGVAIWRHHCRSLTPVHQQISEFREARELRARQQQRAIAAPVPQITIHFHGAEQAQNAPAVLRAIAENTQQGEAR